MNADELTQALIAAKAVAAKEHPPIIIRTHASEYWLIVNSRIKSCASNRKALVQHAREMGITTLEYEDRRHWRRNRQAAAQ